MTQLATSLNIYTSAALKSRCWANKNVAEPLNSDI